MKKVCLILILFCTAGALNAQNPFHAAFVDDTLVLSITSPTGSIQWQETNDTTLAWTNIPSAVVNNYIYRITAVGNGYKYFRAKITNPSICSIGFYYTRVIKCRIVSNATQIQIGDIYAGGYVIYKNGYNGIVAAMSDQGQTTWGCDGVSVGAAGTVVWTGQQNTDEIIAGCVEMGIAAKLCNNITTAGYSDWYLPSIDELAAMYALHTSGKGNFSTTTSYWSSSQNNPNNARAFPFSTGNPYLVNKSTSLKVRAVRYYYAMSVQQRLNAGETPLHIFNSGMSMDSLYGKTYAGGLIFYLNTTNGSGIVCAAVNQADGPWGDNGVMVGCTGSGIGSGPGNTSCLEGIFTASGTAADNCANLIINGYDDWFLPSSSELSAMYYNLHVKGLGGFSSSPYYWTSTMSDYNGAYRISFGSFQPGEINGISRPSILKVRAARNFSNATSALFTQYPNTANTNEIVPNPPTITSTLINKTVCPGSSTFLNVTYTGDAPVYFYWQKNGVDISGSNNDTLFFNTATYADTASYRCIIYNGCDADTSNYASLKIPVVFAGLNQSICENNSTVNLAGSVMNATDVVWSGGNGTFTPNVNTVNAVYVPTAPEISSGSLNLTLTTTAGGLCTALRDTMHLTFTPTPVVTAGTDQNLCQSSLPLTLNGSVTNAGGGIWSGGGGTYNPLNTSMNASYNPSAGEINAGTVTLTLTSTDHGNCLAVSNQVTFNITKTPTANAGTNASACSVPGTFTLDGSATNATNGIVWSGGNGTFVPDVYNLNAVYTPTPTEIANGILTLTITTAPYGYCAQATDNVTISFAPVPIVDAGTGMNLCESSFPITLNGSVTNAGGGIWTGGTGTYNPFNTSLNGTYNPSVEELNAGTVTLTLTSTSNGSCQAVEDQVTYNFSKVPTISAGNDIVVCNTVGSVDLSGVITNAASGLWTGGAGGFNPNNTSLTASYSPSLTEISSGGVTLTLTTSGSGYCPAASDEVHITIGPDPTANVLSQTDPTCYGFCNGTAEVSVSGGTLPYSYLWPASAGNLTTTSAGSLCYGDYIVSISDGAGCHVTTTVSLYQPDVLYANVSSISHNECWGDSEGIVSTSASGGTSPYAYSWSNGSHLANAYGLAAGTYSVTIIDDNGCYKLLNNITVNQATKINISVSTSNAMCNQNDGTATAGVNGGAGSYTYLWSNNETTNPATGFEAGSHFVIVTDANDCNMTKYFPISNDGGFTLSATTQDIACAGSNNGSINMTIAGGSAPFEIEWSNGATTEDISALAPGSYDVIVTDIVGCYGMESYIILDGDTVSSSSGITLPTCNQADGSIIITTSGGTIPYTFNWSNAAGNVSSQTGLTAGNYQYTVSDANNCSSTGFIGLTNDGAPVVNIDSVLSAPCGGSGGVYISISGGAGPYTYNWSNTSSDEDLVNVSPGMYQVTVTDLAGCASAEYIEVPTEYLPIQPICIVTVDTTYGRNLIVWERTAITGVDYYKIYRESSVPNQFQMIATVDAVNMTEYLDMAANPFVRSFRYKISAVDMCGNETALSNLHKTLHLTMNQGVGMSYNLIWDDYEGFAYNTVIAMRYLPTTGWVTLDSLPMTLHSYTDLAPSTSGIRYLVKIDSPDACEPTDFTKEIGGPYSSSFSNMEDEGLAVSAEGTDGSIIDFMVYPNPAKEFITLKAITNVEDNLNIRIFNYTGQLVFSHNGEFSNELKMDISDLASGMYILQIDGKYTYRTRFVVE